MPFFMLLVTSLLALVARASDVVVSRECPHQALCFQLSIPDRTAAEGRGDIYMQIRARTTYTWVAFGQGSHMRDSNMFVLYGNGAGNNVTLSTRRGAEYIQPQYDDHARVTLLEGTSVRDGYMTANIRCSNCDSWPGGSMNFRGEEANFIWAAKLGELLQSSDVHHSIHRHDDEGHIAWALSDATGGDDANPFLTAAAARINQGQASSQQPVSVPSDDRRTRLALIHGSMAALVFVVLFPTGGILIRLANFRGGLIAHVSVQILAWLAAIVALGMGIYLATNLDLFRTAHAHPIIGIVLLVMIIGQPVYGWLHHRSYKAHGRRTAFSWAHLSIGRLAVVGGMINGGLGLKLAGRTSSWYSVRYGTVCGVFGALYILAIIYGEWRLRKVRPGKGTFRRMESQEKTRGGGFGDEQGLAVPMNPRPFRLGRGDVLHDAESTEYQPLARERYADDTGSRAGSRAGSPAPMGRLSTEPRSRAASASGLNVSTAYDP